MRRFIAGLVFGLVLVAASVGTSLAIVASMPDEARFLQPCEAEDGPGPCYWDGSQRGNGKGRTYWISPNQEVHYLYPWEG